MEREREMPTRMGRRQRRSSARRQRKTKIIMTKRRLMLEERLVRPGRSDFEAWISRRSQCCRLMSRRASVRYQLAATIISSNIYPHPLWIFIVPIWVVRKIDDRGRGQAIRLFDTSYRRTLLGLLMVLKGLYLQEQHPEVPRAPVCPRRLRVFPKIRQEVAVTMKFRGQVAN